MAAEGFDMSKAVLLCMDFQHFIVDRNVKDATSKLRPVVDFLHAWRKKGGKVMHIAVRFESGHPEVNDRNKVFAGIKKNNLLVKGTKDADFIPDMTPRADELVFEKSRFGAFSTTGLQKQLEADGVEHLVMMGISTGGVVLSTTRDAADKDYKITILSDCCFDANSTVHSTLMEHVLSRQADITTSHELLASMA